MSHTKYAGISLLSLLAIWGYRQLGLVSLDWGYYLTKAAIGQPAGNGQWTGAMILTLFVFPAIAAGTIGGALTAMFGGKYRWHLATMCSMIGMLFLVICKADNLLEPQFLAVLAAMIVGYVVVAIPTRWFFSELCKRTTPTNLLLACIPSLVFAAFLPINDLETSWKIELPIYCELVILSGWLAALAMRSKTYEMASAAATLAVLPITIFNIVNVAFVFVCMTVIPSWDIEWHAMASALTISAVTIGCAELGAVLGLLCRRLRSNHSVRFE